jgi:hypothetical protein
MIATIEDKIQGKAVILKTRTKLKYRERQHLKDLFLLVQHCEMIFTSGTRNLRCEVRKSNGKSFSRMK